MRDSRYRSVQVYRYRCCHCRRTFRNYPAGVDPADQTQRLRKLATLYLVLGMSLRGTRMALSAFGVKPSHMTVWRDLQEQADLLEKHLHWKPVRVLGLDGAYVQAWGDVRPVLVAIDLGGGKPIALGYVDEYNPQAVRRWLAAGQTPGSERDCHGRPGALQDGDAEVGFGTPNLPVPCAPLGGSHAEGVACYCPRRMGMGDR